MACEVILGGSDELDGPGASGSAGVVVVRVADLLASECVNSMPAVADRGIKLMHQLLSSRMP